MPRIGRGFPSTPIAKGPHADVAAATNAQAELASGTGAAYGASTKVEPTSGSGSGTGAAGNAAVNLAPNSGAGTGTGAAGGSTSTVAPTAGAGSGTGAANGPSVSLTGTSGSAGGTGTAGGPNATVGASGATASGTGSAGGLSASVATTSGTASGTGTAYDATVTTSSNASASAEAATGSGSAGNVSASLAPNAGSVSGTGAAGGPSSSVSPTAGAGTGTGAAFNTSSSSTATAEAASGTGSAGGASASLAPNSGAGSGTGAAGGPSSAVAPTAGAGSGTGSAYDATVSTTTGDTSASAEAATGTGAAVSPSASLAPSGGVGSGSGASGGSSSSVSPTAGAGSGTGAALDATVPASGIAFRAETAWTAVTTESLTITLPTHVTGDMLIIRLGGKVYNNTFSLNQGWTAVGARVESGTSAGGAGSGSTGIQAWYKIATSSSETAPTLTVGGAANSTPTMYCALSYSKPAGTKWETPVGDGGIDNSSNATISATINSHVAVTAGDMVDFFYVTHDNNVDTVPTITQTGVTFDTVVEMPAAALSTTVGNDASADGGYRLATAGTSSAAAVVTGTINETEIDSTAWMTRLRTFLATDASAEVATGTGAAGGASANVAPNAGAGSGTGTAYNATVSNAPSTSAPAELASGTGAAYGPTPSVGARNATRPSGTGTAYDPSVTVISPNALPGVASGTGIARDAKVSIKASAGTATGTGTAYQATVDATNDVSVNAGLASGSGTAYPPTVALLVDGVDPITTPGAVRCTRFFLDDVDITDIVILKLTYVEASAQGKASVGIITVRDLGQDPGTFVTGTRVRIDLGSGAPIYQGYLLTASRRFWFPVDDPDKLQRQWVLSVADINILFGRRIVYNKSSPANIKGPTYSHPSYDDDAIANLVTNWVDLSADDLDTGSLVERVGAITVAAGQPTYPWQGSMTFGEAMQTIAALPAGIFFIDPDRRLVYADVDVESAPFALSDFDASATQLTDDFARIVGAGADWGTGDLGTWEDDGNGDADLSVDGSVGMVDATAEFGYASQIVTLPSYVTAATDWRASARFRWPNPLGGPYPWFEIDFEDASLHRLGIYLDYSDDYAPTAPGPHIYFSVGQASPAFSFEETYLDPPVAGGWANVAVEWNSVSGLAYAKYWPDGDPEPDWLLSFTYVPGTFVDPFLHVWVGTSDGGSHMEVDDIRLSGSDTFDAPVEVRGYREASIEEIADLMVNDYLAYGFGRGRAVGVYKRQQDAASIALHDRWQDARVIFDIYKQATINRHADAIINGSPSSKRGRKDDRVQVKCVTYAHGLRVGQRVRFVNEAHGYDDIIPIRTMRMTFPTPCDVRYELTMSHEYDAEWSLYDKLPVPRIPSPQPVLPPPVVIPDGGGVECGDCEGIFDAFGRTLPGQSSSTSAWGAADAGPAWLNISPTAQGFPTDTIGVDGSRGFYRNAARPASGVSSGLATRLRVQSTIEGFSTMDETFTIEISPTPNVLSDAGEQYYNIIVAGGINMNYAHIRWVPVTGQFDIGSNLNSLDNRDTIELSTVSAAPSAMTFRIVVEMDVAAGTLHIQAKAWTSGTEPGTWDLDGTYTNGVNTNGDDVDETSILMPFFFDAHWLNTLNQAGTHDIYNYFDNFILTLDGVVIDACAANHFDDFNRAVSAGWGAGWTIVTSPSGTTRSVDGSSAVFTHTSGSATSTMMRATSAPVTLPVDVTMLATFVGLPPTSRTIRVGMELSAGASGVGADVAITSTGVATLDAYDYQDGVQVSAGTFTDGAAFYLRMQIDGTVVRSKTWPATSAEPGSWGAEYTYADPAPTDTSTFDVYSVRNFAGSASPSNEVDIDWISFVGFDAGCAGCADAYAIDDFTNRTKFASYPTNYDLGTSSMGLPWALAGAVSGCDIDLNSSVAGALRLIQTNSSNTGQIAQLHTLLGAAPGSKTVTWAFMVDHVGDGDNGPTGTGGSYVQMSLGNAQVWLRFSTGSLSASVPGQYQFAADNNYQIVAKTDWVANALYYVKVEIIEYKTAKFKFWLASEDEPDWMLTDTYIQSNSGRVFIQATNRAHPQATNVVTFTGITAESSDCSEEIISGSGPSCESPATTDNRHFQTRQPFVPGSAQVFVEGLRKRNPTDYTEDPSGAEIIFGATLSIPEADSVYVCYLVDEGFVG